jgi:hypothetical protein
LLGPRYGAAKHAGGAPPPIACPAPTAAPQPCAGAQGSYRNIPDSNASACCAACYIDDHTPCAGWILQPGEKGQQPICHLKTSARFIVPDPEGSAHCGLVRNISGPPAPPAPGPMYPIKPAPPGAKNVLFIISDGAQPAFVGDPFPSSTRLTSRRLLAALSHVRRYAPFYRSIRSARSRHTASRSAGQGRRHVHPRAHPVQLLCAFQELLHEVGLALRRALAQHANRT